MTGQLDTGVVSKKVDLGFGTKYHNPQDLIYNNKVTEINKPNK
jgi:hypothetical protein